jgi:phosphoribosylformylglycinamidine synthase PurS subunit
MQFVVYINILPLDEILDPGGKATLHGLHTMGYPAITDVRIGKRLRLKIEAKDAEEVKSIAEDAAKKLLVNLIMERFEIEVAQPV